MSVRLRYDKVDKYIVHARLESPMHIGAGEGNRTDILLHPNTRLPFIQASSITGVMRDYYDTRFGNAKLIYGSQNDDNEHALIRISDGIFDEQSARHIEFRPRVKIDPDSGSVSSSSIKGTNASSGHKFDTEYIGAGAEFSFTVYVFRDKEFDAALSEHIADTFAAINNGEVVFGGQKSSGCGNVAIKHLYHRLFDLCDKNDRSAWMQEDELKDADYEDLAGGLASAESNLYRIHVTGKIESGILVKGYHVDGFGKNAPDAVNLKNNMGDSIIPGSSLKGAIRSRVSYISGVLGLDGKVIDEIFGSESSDQNAITGNARFYDTVIGTKNANDSNDVTNRIHLDKFTGGVIYKALFKEKRAFGALNSIKIDVINKNNPDRSVGMLLLALRDLANGLYNLGGGYHIGQGFVDVEKIVITHNDQKAEISFKDNIVTDPDRIIDKCLGAVKG